MEPSEPRERLARVYAKWSEWPVVAARIAEARGADEHDAWVRAWTWAMRFRDCVPDLPAIYAQTTARDVRRSLFERLTQLGGPPPLDLMRRLADLERDADLRARYDRVLAAYETKKAWEVDVRAILFG
jgi:hypothetical protein